MEIEITIGTVVIWVDEDLQRHEAIVKKIKRDNQLDLEYANSDPKVVVTSGAHRSNQHPDYGNYWMAKEEANV